MLDLIEKHLATDTITTRRKPRALITNEPGRPDSYDKLLEQLLLKPVVVLGVITAFILAFQYNTIAPTFTGVIFTIIAFVAGIFLGFFATSFLSILILAVAVFLTTVYRLSLDIYTSLAAFF